ncbi:hypothetical protein [Lactobacillus sp. Sy-1]|uniref:hypothetical protein n=1 Tax=Lactobacillus sp. Sy-1 TaxID=2109645 RepID=UPI001C58C9F7|nr:hypothetical protein [Lactobacillus sp. Sy-1]MBW1605481.1 hypothetical protein [Lactobacillus sp. Sy-1]
MAEDSVEITPGSKEFNNMVFRLNDPVVNGNTEFLNYAGNALEPLQDDIYVMPAFVNDDFNLFIVVSKLIANDWIIAFSKAKIENGNEITDLSEPIPTGEGLNMLGERQPEEANSLLQYFNNLIENNRGEWRLIQRPDAE